MPDVRALPTLRALFLLAAALFAYLGLRGRFGEIGDALDRTSFAAVAGALLVVLVGLLATGLLWLRLMSCVHGRLPVHGGLATFFVGQLGKYIPGSVWSLGAQADLARRQAVAPRVTIGVGLVFLGYHLDTAVLVGSLALLTGRLESPWPDWVSWVSFVVALTGLAPGVVRALGRRVTGQDVRLGAADTVVAVGLMGVAWTAYAWAMVLLSPGLPAGEVVALGGAFALAYAAGVAVVFAPAGVGAREVVFVLLLGPATGVGAATALALLARAVHTVADASMASAWWLLARRDRDK